MCKEMIIVFCIVVVIGFFFIPYFITDGFKKNKICKFIPSILCAIAVLLLDIKFNYLNFGYDNLIDIVFILLLIGCFFIFFIAALIFNYINQ